MARPAGSFAPEDALDQLLVQGIEAGKGLVQDQELRPMGDGRGELHLLGHAAGEVLHPPVDDLAQAEALQQVDRPPARRAAVEPLQPGEEGDRLGRLHPPIEPALLRQIADAAQKRPGPGLSEQPDHAGIGRHQAEDHAQGRGLAGAIGAEEAEHFAGADLEGKVVDRPEVSVGLRRDGRPRGRAAACGRHLALSARLGARADRPGPAKSRTAARNCLVCANRRAP